MGSALLLLALSFILASNAAAQGVPTLSITGDTVGTVFEDGSDAMLNASGRLTITDGSLMDYTFVVQSGMPGIYGTFSIDAEGNWMYMLDNNNPATDALAIGAEVTDTFTAVSSDDGTVDQEVAITITGANDAPTIININALPSVAQGAEITLISQVNDVDTGDEMLSYAWSAEGDLGLFTNGTGRVDTRVSFSFSTTWRAPDEIRGVRLNLTVTDDNGAVNSSFSAPPFFVEVTPASLEINGAITGSVTEDDPASTMASGMLTIDTTANNRDFVPQTDTGMYGTFEIDVGGAWTYILDNNAPATNALAAGAEETDTFTVASSLRPTSDTQEVTITVTGANDPPAFDPTSYAFNLAENRDGSTAPIEVGTGTGTGTGTVTATDPEGDTIAYSITVGDTTLFSIGETSGVIAYTGTGENFEAVPPPYILEITATAGGQMNTAPVTVTIADANDAPVVSITAPANDVEVKQGVSVFLSGEGNDEDTGDTLSYAWSASPDVGSFTNGDTLNATWAAPDPLDPVTLTLTVTDDSGDVNDSGTDSVTVTIIRAPLEIRGDTVGMVTEDAPSNITRGALTIATTANDRNFVQTDTPVPGIYGSFTINTNGAWTYTLDNTDPDTNALAAGDRVTDDPFTVMSRLQPTVTEVVTITITGANDAPVARDDAFTVLEGGIATMLTGGEISVLANDDDVDAGATLMVMLVDNVRNGTLTLDGDGTFSYTHDGSENHDDLFTYRVSDGIADSNEATVTITVTPQDDAPVFDPASYDFTLEENQDGSASSVAVGTVTATDAESDAITYSISSGDTTRFDIDEANGAIAYTGAGEDFEAGPPPYILEITATAGGQMNTAPVTVTIADANDAPVATITEPAATNIEVPQGMEISLTGTGDDDDTGDTLSYAWSASPDVGSFTNGDMLNATWTAPDPLDPVTLTLTVTDDSGDVNDSGTDSVTVTIIRAPLEIRGDTVGMVTEDAAIITANGDLDITTTASDRTFVQTDTPVPGTYGSFTIATNGIWTYTLDNTDLDTNALGEGAEVTDTFTVMSRLQPAAATEDVTITITGANDAPIALDDVFLAVEGSGTGGELPPATDVDTDEFLLSVITTPVENVSRGSLTLSDDFTFDYEHDGSETTSDRFTYRVMDDFGAVSNVATVIITVTPEDDPPEFEEAAYDFDLAENLDGSTTSFAVGTVIATDAESDPIIYSISSGDTARFNIDETSGVIAYIGTGEDFEAGPSMYMLEVTATSNSETATAEVTVTVTDEREIGPPEFEDTPYSFNLAENLDGSTTPVVVGRVLANAPDDPDITYRISSGDTDRFDIQSLSGRIRYTGAGENFEAAPSMYILEITATTTDGLDDMAQVTVTITDANDVPAAEAGPAQIVDEGASVTLDGSSSTDMDLDDDTLNFNYAWTQTEVMTVTLTGADTVSPTFTAPTGLSEDETLTFQLIVTDVGGRPSEPDTVIITVATPPSFGDTVIEIQRYTTGRDVPSVTLPEPTGGGDGLYTYTVDDQDLPAGVSFDATTRVISGTVTAPPGRATHTYTVTDGRNATDTISFDTIIVNPPSFGTATFPDLTFVVRDPVDLTLPPATEGSPPLSYKLERAFDDGPLPIGLSLVVDSDRDEPILTGTPSRLRDNEYRYIATDANGAEARAGFRITIETNVEVASPNDVNADTIVQVRDPQIIYYVALSPPNLDALLDRLRGFAADVAQLRTRATAWLDPSRVGRTPDPDLNGDETLNQQDARILYYALRFEDELRASPALRQALGVNMLALERALALRDE